MYKKIFLLVIVLIIVYVLLTYVKNMILYHPLPALEEKYDRFFQKITELTEPDHVFNTKVKTPDNVYLDTIGVCNPNSNKYIIFFHGNSGNISMRFDMIKFLHNYASVIIFDYRSFGRSTGDVTSLSADLLFTDAGAIWNFVTSELKIAPNNISLFGESLGCSIAIHLASKLSETMDNKLYPHSLILNAPFFSLSSMIESSFGKFNLGLLGKVVAYFIGSEYNSDKFIQLVNHKTKIIIAHSPRDEVVPYAQGMALYQSISEFRSDVNFVNISGTHNNLGLTDTYIYMLADLFD